MNNNKNKSERFCRICGLDHGEEGVRMSSGMPTFNICECCGTEFGYDDLNNWSQYRKYWLYELKCKWMDETYKPANWSLCTQLLNIPEKFKDDWTIHI